MDLKITPEALAKFRDKDSKKPHFRELYEKHDFLTAYAKHTDLRVQADPKWSIGRGDEWESHGKMQLEFMISEGMRPDHELLDVGCGVGRAARRFVPYLNTGNYTGVDISDGALEHARQLAIKEGWNSKEPLFLRNGDLDFHGLFDFPLQFDFMWAHSVFTHLPPQQIQTMMGNASKLLPSGGKFLFTYKPEKVMQRSGLKQFQFPPALLIKWAEERGFRGVTTKQEWPAGQRTIRLTKP